jgi:hypothetical protein
MTAFGATSRLARVSAKDRKPFVISAVRAVVAKGSFG